MSPRWENTCLLWTPVGGHYERFLAMLDRPAQIVAFCDQYSRGLESDGSAKFSLTIPSAESTRACLAAMELLTSQLITMNQ